MNDDNRHLERRIVDAAQAHVVAHRKMGYCSVLFEASKQQNMQCGDDRALSRDLVAVRKSELEVDETWARLVDACHALDAMRGER